MSSTQTRSHLFYFQWNYSKKQHLIKNLKNEIKGKKHKKIYIQKRRKEKRQKNGEINHLH